MRRSVVKLLNQWWARQNSNLRPLPCQGSVAHQFPNTSNENTGGCEESSGTIAGPKTGVWDQIGTTTQEASRDKRGERNHNWKGGFSAYKHKLNFRRKNPEKARAHDVLTTRVIRITECHQCPFRFLPIYQYGPKGIEYGCELHGVPPLCPPTGTPDWCPLEVLEEKGGEG